MFRYIAVGGGLFLFLIWAGPIIVNAARRMIKKSNEVYDDADAEGTEEKKADETD